MSDAPAVEFRNVSFSYGSAPVLGGFSLAIPAGGVTGIVGPNGCGKSTLLKLADGLLAPTTGEVCIYGRAVPGMGACERARLVALLPQVHRTPAMTVRDLVMCGRYAHMGVFGRPGAEDERAVDAALEEVGIASFAGKMARRRAGGPSSPWPWRRMPASCYSTSRRPTSTCVRRMRRCTSCAS